MENSIEVDAKMEITAIGLRIQRRCIKLKEKSRHGIFPLLSNEASFKMLKAERQGRNAEALLLGLESLSVSLFGTNSTLLNK